MTRGFTLIEVLVALGILSIAALALIHVQGESAKAAGAVRARLFGEIAAENQLVEALAVNDRPVIGVSEGESTVGGQSWRWAQTIARADGQILRVDVTVRGAGDAVVSQLSAFRSVR